MLVLQPIYSVISGASETLIVVNSKELSGSSPMV